MTCLDGAWLHFESRSLVHCNLWGFASCVDNMLGSIRWLKHNLPVWADGLCQHQVVWASGCVVMSDWVLTCALIDKCLGASVHSPPVCKLSQ